MHTSSTLCGMTPVLARISGAMMPAAPSIAHRAWMTSLHTPTQTHHERHERHILHNGIVFTQAARYDLLVLAPWVTFLCGSQEAHLSTVVLHTIE